MTLRWHFVLEPVFINGLTRFFCFAFGADYVKTNEDAAILAAQICILYCITILTLFC